MNNRYSKTSADTLWSSMKTSTQTVTRKKKEIYPQFNDAAELVEEKFWKDIFLGLAKGSVPKNFTIRDRKLQLRKPGKINPIEIPSNDDDDTRSVVDRFKKFFIDCGFRGSHEMDMENRALIDNLRSIQTLRNTEWRKLGKKNRGIYIEEYIQLLGKRLKLTLFQDRKLLDYLWPAYHKKEFDSSIYIIENDMISSIDNLRIEEDNTDEDITWGEIVTQHDNEKTTWHSDGSYESEESNDTNPCEIIIYLARELDVVSISIPDTQTLKKNKVQERLIIEKPNHLAIMLRKNICEPKNKCTSDTMVSQSSLQDQPH